MSRFCQYGFVLENDMGKNFHNCLACDDESTTVYSMTELVLKVTPDNAESFLVFLETQRRDYAAKLSATERQISDIKKALDKSPGAPTSSQPVNGSANKTPSGRLRRGQAEPMIENCLRELKPGTGITLGEIVKKTGVSASSAYRVLQKMKGEGRVKNHGALWML